MINCSKKLEITTKGLCHKNQRNEAEDEVDLLIKI